MGTSDKPGELDIIRRDTECLLHRGSVRAMSQLERDRHTLVMLLGLARAQKTAAETALVHYADRVGHLQRVYTNLSRSHA